MVTLISQDLSEFDLHLRAILGFPIPKIEYRGPSASAVVLAGQAIEKTPSFNGVGEALAIPNVDVRIFGKPSAREYRRMGVTLARAESTEEARAVARRAAAMIDVL